MSLKLLLLTPLMGLMLASSALAHDHWINHGGYEAKVAVYDGPTSCCGEGDCFEVPGTDVKGGEAGYTLPGGWFMAYPALHQSPNSRFWACFNFDAKGQRSQLKCLFAPGPGI